MTFTLFIENAEELHLECPFKAVTGFGVICGAGRVICGSDAGGCRPTAARSYAAYPHLTNVKNL